MRDSNYRSVANNRAAVTITTSLYDRRALDVTSDKPLVNSLNHLTYLVSSSAKVRDTLSNDGGIERLVEILHECHATSFTGADSIFNSERKILTAWKWTLAFQCLVLIGTRGSEKIRQNVVRAGMLPVIATVLDNYISLHEGSFLGLVPAPQTNPLVCPHYHFLQQHTDQQPHLPFASAGDTQAGPALSPPATQTFGLNLHAEQQPAEPIPASLDVPFQDSPCVSFDSCLKKPSAYSSQINNLTSEDFENLLVDQLFKLVRGNVNLSQADLVSRSSVSNDIRRRFLIISIVKKLRDEKENEFLHISGLDDCEYDMDNKLQFLSNLYLQDEKSAHMFNAIHYKIAPRNFTETGVVIPRDDDVEWCLQLLAYILKYPYLKDVLQNTHLVVDMSIREKQTRLILKKELKKSQLQTINSRDLPKAGGQIFSPSALPHSAAMINDGDDFIERFNLSPSNSPHIGDLNIRNDNFDLAEDKLDLYTKASDHGLTEDAEANEFDDDLDNLDEDSDHRNRGDDEVEDYLSNFDDVGLSAQSSSYLSRLYDCILDAESIVDDLDRELALFRLSDRVNEHIHTECKKLSNTIIEKRLEQKECLSKIWNYDTYENFDIDEDNLNGDNDFDESLIDVKKINLFPMVEKFTFLAGTEMNYWSGVIMRNSCRRNDFKGGVRQCGNLECGKWEKYPREFSKCKRCKRTKYCSRECQMRAWHCHKNWCTSGTSTSSATTQTSHTPHEAQRPANDPSEDPSYGVTEH